MRWLKIAASLAACFPLAGCAERGDGNAGDSKRNGVHVEWGPDGVKVTAPGTDVKVDPKNGVDVKAPGTNVRVHPQNGVDVKAPGTDVKVDPQNGVDVKAPGTDVHVE